jgi:type II secretory pathway pseudopilin PulG
MIVVAIIVILVSLVLAVMVPVLGKSEERVTRNLLAQLDTAMQEWERQVDRRVTFQNATSETGAWDVAFNPDLSVFGNGEGLLAAPFNNSLPDQRTVFLLETIGQQATVRDILAKLPVDNFRNVRLASAGTSNVKAVFDAWGTPIRAVFPGRDWVSPPDTGNADLDGSIRTVSEDGSTPTTSGFGICRNRRVLFVSAGPDLSFTDVASTPDIDERADNLYSYGEVGQ